MKKIDIFQLIAALITILVFLTISLDRMYTNYPALFPGLSQTGQGTPRPLDQEKLKEQISSGRLSAHPARYSKSEETGTNVKTD